MEARAQWDFLFFQDGVLCRGWETESGYRLTYQIVHWADCNAVGPSPDGGVGGTIACSRRSDSGERCKVKGSAKK